jgi:hypothetical protein
VWRWQRLLPTNLTLYVFELGTHRTDVQLSGSLPSAQAFESILGSPASFSYDLNLTVVSKIKTERLPALAEVQGLRPDTLDGYYDSLDTRITQIATDSVMSLVQHNTDSLSLSGSYSFITGQIADALTQQLPDLEIQSVSASRISLPDMTLYNEARQLSDDLLAARADALVAAAQASAEAQDETERELLMLERYGDILTRYPVLLEYFQLGKDLDSDPLDLNSILPPTVQ